MYFSTNPSCCQELFSSFSPTFQPVSCDSFDIIAFLSSIVKGFSQTFFFFLRQSGTLSFPTALSKLSQLLSSKLAPHCRQVTLIFPFPLGTRSFTPQDGHLKTLYCRFCSIFARQFRPMRNPRVIARNFWFSCCLRPKFWENARTQQKAAAKKASPMKQIGQSPGWCKQRAYPAEDCQHKKSNIQLIDSISSSEQSVKHGSHHFFASLLRIWPFFCFLSFRKTSNQDSLLYIKIKYSYCLSMGFSICLQKDYTVFSFRHIAKRNRRTIVRRSLKFSQIFGKN